jgi:hypothetical protein
MNPVHIPQMRGSLPRLVGRVISKSEIAGQSAKKVYPAPLTAKQPTVTTLELLLKQRAEAGADYPANIRLEPSLIKTTLARVPPDIRAQLMNHLKER